MCIGVNVLYAIKLTAVELKLDAMLHIQVMRITALHYTAL